MNRSSQLCVDVIFLNPPYGPLTYRIPDSLKDKLKTGVRVLVPLGRRKLVGIVSGLVQSPIRELKDVESVVDETPVLSADLVRLTQWIAEYYMASWGEAVRTALPPGVQSGTALRIEPAGLDPAGFNLNSIQRQILSLVSEKNGMDSKSLSRKLGDSARGQLDSLERLGIIRMRTIVSEAAAKPLMARWIELVKEPDAETLVQLKKRSPRRAAVIKSLAEAGGSLRRDAIQAGSVTLNDLVRLGWISIREEEQFRDGHPGAIVPSKPVVLTEEQNSAVNEIVHESGFRVFLLFGVTGSGKTQVYIEAVRKVLESGRTALILIPEISLTPQAVARYRGAFGDAVAVLHSRMSAGERADAWRWIRQGKFKIALGPRSAVFAPLENLGVVVVDEEHESSYKQNDPAPRYNARDVAVMRAMTAGCPVILGSATPSLESYHNAVSGKYKLLQLTQRIDETPMPVVTVVPRPGFHDASPIFSTLLLERIAERLGSKEQVILLQNRRGYATLLRCGSCGFIEGCPHCDITLTFHQKGRSLRCHYCGYEKAASESCSQCGGVTIKYKGVGTQQVEEALQRHHPDARIIRMDLDTTRHKGSHDRIVTEFEKGKGDILLGTQMVAKGHDFPGVRLVGVVSADTELNFPDFRAGERAFQLLTQAAGRAGRRSLTGEVVIQSVDPANPLFQFVIDQHYERFYEWASAERRVLNYPPFGRLISVRFRGPDSGETATVAESFKKRFRPQSGIEILGPAPSPLERLRGLYRYQMLFRSSRSADPSGEKLRNAVRQTLEAFPKRNGKVRISVDVDPLDMM